jgi:hypothetical protein
MPVNSSVDGPDNVAVKERAPTKRPPLEEKDWKYYSQHHEMPLSSISSVTIHILGVALLVVGGLLAARFSSTSEPLALDVATDPGGGGNPEGDPNSAAPATARAETASDVKESSSVKPKSEVEPATPKVESQALPVPESDNGRRIAEESQKASAQAGKAVSEAEKALQQATGARPSKGKGGTGAGGGQGSGFGPGEGSGHDAGIMTKREQRRRRWQLEFHIKRGTTHEQAVDHLNQFAALGAILAVPEPNGGFRVFRDVRSRHPRGVHVDDLSEIHRIGFANQEPETAPGLAMELGMPPMPYFLAFFPESLEKKMLQMELSYRGAPEEDIHQKMHFKVERDPIGGGYDVVVDTGSTR